MDTELNAEEEFDDDEFVEEEEEEEEEIPEFDFRDLTSDSNVEMVKYSIDEKYGFLPTDEYVIDLIAFVHEMMNRPDGSTV